MTTHPSARAGTDDGLDALIGQVTLLRRDLAGAALEGEACVVSGRPADWTAAAAAAEAAGSKVVGFHDIRRGWRRALRRRFRGSPVVRGAIEARFPAAAVVFAGRPTKTWFNPSPPGPERCLWHVPPLDWQRAFRHTPTLL